MKHLNITLATFAVILAFASTALGQESSITPYVGIEGGGYDESLRLDVAGTGFEETRRQWAPRLSIGLDYPIPRHWVPLPTDTTLHGQSELGYGAALGSGHYAVHTRHRALLRWRPTSSSFTLQGGLGLGLNIGTTNVDYSYADLAVPLGMRWGFFELMWRPAVRLALSSESSKVFAGTRQKGVDDGLEVLSFVAIFRVSPLAW